MEPSGVAPQQRTAHQRQLEVRRLSAGAFADRLRAAPDAVKSGGLPATAVLPLIDRRVSELGRALGSVTDARALARSILRDELLDPLLALKQVRDVIQDAFPEQPIREAFALVVEAIGDVERAGDRAEPYITVAARFGLDVEHLRTLHRRVTIDERLGQLPEERDSRRTVQHRHAGRAAREGTPWKPGRGRRPGAEGAKVRARQLDLRARFDDLDAQAQVSLARARGAAGWVAEHAERWQLTRRTAERDWRHVRGALVDEGKLDLLGKLISAASPEERQRERERVERLKRQFGVAGDEDLGGTRVAG